MKVKIFKSPNAQELENQVNSWFDQNPFFIEAIKYSSADMRNWVEYSVLIMYRLRIEGHDL